MSYIALYREWRPKIFNDIIGQEHITQTLKNQIKQQRIAHAYLFCGTRGTGKTTTAKVFARAVNCLHPDGIEPCGKCEVCTGIENGNLMDVIEIDAASNNGVDNIRELRDDVKYPPTKCRYKVYIIDEVHMLSTAAFNALLKTLEEPPGHVIFILATTEFQKVPATILSRCQRFDFKRIKNSDIVKRLRMIADESHVNVEDRVLNLIARNSDGAMRDAVSIFDQCISSSGGNVEYSDVLSMLGVTTDEYLIKVTDCVAEGDTAKCISLIDELIINGKDVYQFIKDLTMHFRNLLISSINDEALNILNVSEEIFEEFKIQAKKFSTEGLLRNINILSGAETDAKWVSQPRIILEMAIIRMCRKELSADIDSILDRIASLERALSHGIPSAVQANKKHGEEPPMIKSLGQGTNRPETAVSHVKNEVQHGQAEQVPDASFQDIAKKWKEILKAINTGGYKTLYAFLLEGKPVGMQNGVLNIGFEKKYEFHRGRVEEESNRKVAEEFVSSVCGIRVRIKCSIIDEIAADKQEGSFAEKTRSIFGRDIVEVEE